ncbi:PilZ domain-containing protein [Solirubrobacter soli]|uniref:PilZ domain-containing protein n=1 Tax=Solirubrobacter soli TaxID=363832 RepID=UPI0012FAC71E|nr:PilZ domain-containing protein [Solirubrobacter soli]
MRRLSEFDVVTLNVPFEALHARTIDVFDARVLAVVGPTAALEPIGGVDVYRLPERVSGALLSFRNGRTLVGLKGRLTARRDSGDVRFTVGDGVQLDRRAATRVPASFAVHLHRLGTLETRPGRSIDLSADGLLVQTTLKVIHGDALQVSIWLEPDAPPVEATAHVTRIEGDLIALQFAVAEVGARSRLARLVVEHNRAELRSRAAAYAAVEF